MYETLTASIADVERMQRQIDDIAVLVRVIDQGGKVVMSADGLATKVMAESAVARSLLAGMSESLTADVARLKAALDAATDAHDTASGRP